MTSTKRVAYCLVLAVCLGACSNSTDGPPADDDPPTSDEPNDEPSTEASLVFSPSYEAAEAGETQTEFDLLSTEEIIATFAAPATDGVQVVRTDLYAPSGAIYQRYWRAYSSDPELVGTEVPHPDMAGTLRVDPVATEGGASRLYLRIPVSGTTITKNLLTGTFRHEILFEGEAEPAAAAEFEVVKP